jgi:hypothetical protein
MGHGTTLPHDPGRPQPAEDPAGARALAINHQRKDDRRLHARGRTDGDSGTPRSRLLQTQSDGRLRAAFWTVWRTAARAEY